MITCRAEDSGGEQGEVRGGLWCAEQCLFPDPGDGYVGFPRVTHFNLHIYILYMSSLCKTVLVSYGYSNAV